MLSGISAELVSLALLVAVLAFALWQPRGVTEAAAAAPAAALVVLLGLLTAAQAWRRVGELGPTVGFLAAILLLAHLADAEGVFHWLGERMASASAGRPGRLLGLVFVAGALTTSVLSLDATVVLFTPVVLGTTARLGIRPKPHAYACAHLANSASLLLPVSNLTNLLAFAASGLSFARFAGLMALPWLTVIGAEYLVFRRYFRAELDEQREPGRPARAMSAPRLPLVILALTLLGFGVSQLVGVEPVWVAVVGALALAVRPLVRRRVRLPDLVRATSPLFCVFVLALGIVVTSVTDHGLGRALSGLVAGAGTGLPSLLAVAALAAVLSNVVNNLPATLAMLAALGASAQPGVVLAMLIGVNVGPNLSYVGSLATLLWRRVLTRSGLPNVTPHAGEFTVLGALTVPPCLVVAVGTLWLGLTFGPGWL